LSKNKTPDSTFKLTLSDAPTKKDNDDKKAIDKKLEKIAKLKDQIKKTHAKVDIAKTVICRAFDRMGTQTTSTRGSILDEAI